MTNKQLRKKQATIKKAFAIVENNEVLSIIAHVEEINEANEKAKKFKKRVSELFSLACIEYLSRHKAKYQEQLKKSHRDSFFRDYQSVKFAFKRYMKRTNIFKTHAHVKEIKELQEICS